MGRSLSEAAKYVLAQFECFGVEVSENSRLKFMYKAVCNNDGSSRGLIREDAPGFAEAREAQRDFSQLEFFFEQVGVRDDVDSLPILLRIAQDSVLPQDDQENSPGRDAQAEAFVFAVCNNAGMHPVLEEPDMVCQISGKRFGVAVKRIKNMSQFSRRIYEGARQVAKSKMPGVVDIEVTMAVNPENYSIVTNVDESHVRVWWEEKMRRTVDDCHTKLCNAMRRMGVRGVFLHEHCPVKLGTDYVLRSMAYGVGTSDSFVNKAEWMQLKNAFVSGLPNLAG